MAVTNKTTKASTGTRRRRSATPAPDRDLYLRMFHTMALHRAVEDRMTSMYRQGELLGSFYSGNWHEAIAVGTAAALRDSDFLAPLHRDLGAHLWRGMDPREVMASFMGKATAPTGGRDGTLHYGRLDLNIYNPPSHIPDNYPVATGGAFAFKYRGEDGVALAYCGDGSTGAGDFHEALNIAAVLELPCIFIVENNQYSYSTPLRLTSRSKDFATKAIAYGMPGEKVDGIDVVAVYEATSRAVDLARSGGGPSLIEATTMRMHGHAEHDPADYVPTELHAEWAKRDPVDVFAARLQELEFATADDIAKVKAEVRQLAIDARKQVLADPMAEPDDLEARVYAN
ncbi:thiamine pyrophosphate-dependent dehydrogenase E1 component subunit alpha [[Mycobacterium] crassicus]|uniref:Thiamine pyrophosphate-dependent dehydrogenase E1 component subunit alpha n=1 Tax=[Mycobacterium] crassicus TaxID=2872309 RepID=A0ABU5XIJ8_9MYCO|nr:thiamine pyrophosphate-dependent dehydrogenase E1 component subunit alpha [Mycolicibacter sp. MYC098]MEB3022115.1 thiamine pyrophosphate-dependent dehydrogenase E1 component subunit alpha [Mycolicibacter sp. MYC098]